MAINHKPRIVILFGDTIYDRIRYGDEKEYSRMIPPSICHDCDTEISEFHDIGCDNEECPACHKQLITCGCWIE